jgi:hypothetical protein
MLPLITFREHRTNILHLHTTSTSPFYKNGTSSPQSSFIQQPFSKEQPNPTPAFAAWDTAYWITPSTGLVIKDALNNFAALTHHTITNIYFTITMPSRLRFQEDFDPISTGTIRSSLPPQKKQKMSLTQTYYVASVARSKLGKEASRPDHNLRLLVGTANLLDSLMIELQNAEREQEAWFNQTLKKAQKSEDKHIQWLDTIVQEDDEDSDDAASDSSDSDSEFDEEEFEMQAPLKRLRSPPVTVTSTELDMDEDVYSDDEDSSELALTRTQSHSSHPPELVDDSDSEDDSPPASPPQSTMDISLFDEKNNPLSQSDQAAFFDDGFFIPERNAPMIAAC